MKRFFFLFAFVITLLGCSQLEPTINNDNSSIIGEWSLSRVAVDDGGFGQFTSQLWRFQDNGILYINSERVYKYTLSKTTINCEQMGGYEPTNKQYTIEQLDNETLVLSTTDVNHKSHYHFIRIPQ